MSWWEAALRAMVRRIVRRAMGPLEDRLALAERRLDKLEGPHPYVERAPTSIIWHTSQPTEE